MNNGYHKIQQQILEELLLAPELSFSDMKPEDMEGSQFSFHLHKLEADGLIIKNSSGNYELTPQGKNDANRFDPESATPFIQAKHSAVFCATRNGRAEFLLYERLKNPFYGCQGFPTGKVKYGESIAETAARELHEETNLTGEPEIRAIRHYQVYDANSKVHLEDKVMYIFEVSDPVGDLKGNKEGRFFWVPRADVATIVQNPLEEFAEIYDIVLNFSGAVTFKEVDHYTSKF